jgi:plasmid stability protein
MRNMLVVDLGEDVHGIREALRTKASNDCRSISSIVREILKKTLVDFQVK